MFEFTEAFAKARDAADPLAKYRDEFHLPPDSLYFVGNSLGLQPKKVKQYIDEELEDWARLGVEGHLHARHPWLPYHEFLTASTARLVGALPHEVVVMNTLTVNLHLMMVSFYRPTKDRFKILIEGGAFPSDRYAVASQARFHGFDPATAVVEVNPRAGESTIREEDLLGTIEREGKQVALILLGGVNYLTGQAFPLAKVAELGARHGCRVGFDLAHGVGNLQLRLHDVAPDFAVWCSYKYLNSGPGGLAGCFVHERHGRSSLPRFEGWWGHDKASRFEMGPQFSPIEGAEGWQLSNPPIFPLASLRASMEIFDRATMPAIRKKGDELTAYLEFILDQLPGKPFAQITPRDPAQRGCQLSLRASKDPRELLKALQARQVFCDFRSPDIIRATPVPLYNRFLDVYRLGEIFKQYA